MSGNRALTVVSQRPPLAPRALAGGMLGAGLSVFIAIVGTGTFSAQPLLFFTLVPALMLAGVTALAAYVIQQRRSSFSRLNRDLTNIYSMVERELIDREEYHLLKTRIINEYQPQRMEARSVLGSALWVALVGALIPLLIAVTYAPLGGALLLMALIPGSLAAAAVGGVTEVIYQLGKRRARQLPSGEPAGWEPLGTRQSLQAKGE